MTEPTTAAPPARRRGWAVAAVIFVVTAAVFAPAVRCGFVDFDDGVYVTENPRVLGGFNRESVGWAFDAIDGANWHPITWLTLLADVSVYGLDPAGFHLTNLLLHAATAAALFVFLRRATGSTWRSAAAAVLWAVHPTRVESVAWVSERKDVLSGLFFALALYAYTRYAEHLNRVWYYLGLAAYGLGLMSKPMLVTLPCVLLLLDAWPFGRLRSARDLPALAWEKTPYFILSAVFSLITMFTQHDQEAMHDLEHLPPAERAANALIGYGAYLRMTGWPAELAVQYPLGPRPGWQVTAAAGALLVLTAAAVAARRRVPAVPVGWLWFVGMTFPVSGVVQVGAQAYADRYTYLPQIGLLLALVWAAAAAADRFRVPVWVRAAAVAAAVAGCVVQTERQIPHWSSPRALWERAAAVSPSNSLTWFRIARLHADAGDWDGALRALRQADRTAVVGRDTHYDAARRAFYWEVDRSRKRTSVEWYQLAEERAAAGDWDRALRLLDMADRTATAGADPTHDAARHAMRETILREKRPRE